MGQLTFDFDTKDTGNYLYLIPNLTPTRRCTNCNLEKPLNDFRFTKKNKRRVTRETRCVKCCTKSKKVWEVNFKKQQGITRSQVFYKTYRLQHLVNMVNRRCAGKSIPGVLTVEQWQEMLLLNGNSCSYCGISGDKVKLVIEHVLPVAMYKHPFYKRFVTNDVNNIVPICELCNGAKMGRNLIMFLGWLHHTL